MTVKEIYYEALMKINPLFFVRSEDCNTATMREELISYSNATRQTYEARVARIALKNASYLRINGGS